MTNEETSGEYVGIAKLGREFVPVYLSRVRGLVEQDEKYSMWWEEALFAIRDEFRMKIYVTDVRGHFWAEADYTEDVERIRQWFKKRESETSPNTGTPTHAAGGATPARTGC